MDTRDTLRRTVERSRPDERPAETYASTVTSADTKLAYNHDKDRFEAFLIGDINANPEGTSYLSEGNDGLNYDSIGEVRDDTRLLDVIADGYTHNARALGNGSLDIGVVMHPATYTATGWNDDGWLAGEKQQVVDAIERTDDVETVHYVLPDGDIVADDGSIYVDGAPVDGYANVHDQGDALLASFAGDPETGVDEDQLYAMAKGTNAATAVWNRCDAVRPETDKIGLMDIAADVTAEMDTVHTAHHDTAYTVEDVGRFVEEHGAPAIGKSVLSTWGDGVFVAPSADTNEIADAIRTEEARASSVQNRSDDHRIVDEDGNFVTTSIGDKAANQAVNQQQTYGIVEEAIAGTIERDGDRYTVFDFKGDPVDFVPLATYDPETGQPEVYGINVRSSGTSNLNANRGGKNFSVQSLQQAWTDGVLEPAQWDGDTRYDLKTELETVAGREVAEDEIRTPIEETGYAAWAVRNIAAFRAEEKLHTQRES